MNERTKTLPGLPGSAATRRVIDTSTVPAPVREALHKLARDASERAQYMVRSWSGTDQAESEAYFGAARFYSAVAAGSSIGAALAQEDARWRIYAADQAAKVKAAPKIRGRNHPSRGQSVISHRWVSPEKFTGMMNHLRFMAERCLGQEGRAS